MADEEFTNTGVPDWVLENPDAPTFEGDDLPMEGEKNPTDILQGSTKAAQGDLTHVDKLPGAGPEAGDFDYKGLFAASVKTGGQVAEAIGKGLPSPVAAAAAAAAEAAAKKAADKPGELAKGQGTALQAAPKAGLSTGAKVALAVGAAATVGLIGLAATRRGRR